MSINELAAKAAARKAKRKQKFKAIGKSKGQDYSHLRPHDPGFNLKYTKALSDLNSEYDAKHLRKFALDYMKSVGVIGNSSEIADHAFATFGKIAYIKLHKGETSPETDIWLKQKIEHIKSLMTDTVDETALQAPKRKNVQEYIADKTHDLMAEIDGWIDDRDYTHSIKEYMETNNIKAIHNNLIEDRYKKLALEMQAVFKKSDPEIVAAYKGVYTLDELKDYLKFLVTILKDTKTFVSQKISMRKPRVKKPKSPEKQVAKLNYHEKGSIDPCKIIGAMQLWVFNMKTRKIGVYNAADPDGLKVKGSTLLNVDENNSFCKTLRKPAEQLKEFGAAGKVALRTFMEKINGKNLPMKSRINKDTVLLKVM